MNNVVQLNSKHNPFPQESELYFRVWERPITFEGDEDRGTRYKIDTHKAIVRMWNNSPKSIGVVGSKFKVASTEELCKSTEQVFMEKMNGEELRDVQVKDEVAYFGAKTVRQYIFPNIRRQLSDKSTVGFRTVIVNGYDGSSSFKLYSGAIDFFCSNGMVTGSFDLTVRRHTSGFSIPRLADRVRTNIDIFYQQADTWAKWIGKTITDEDAKEAFEAMPNVSERRVAQLMRQFEIECHSHGRTVWALYSAATFYATHDEGEFKTRRTEANHTPITLLNREQQVRSWVSSDSFLRLAA